MKIVDKINGILSAMTEDNNSNLQSYQYNDKPTANVTLDRNKPSPTALFMQITDWTLATNRANIKEVANINVSFLDKEKKLDAQGNEQDTIISNMKDIAIDFLQRLFADKTLKVLDEKIEMKSVFLRSDSNRSGVNITLKISETQGDCL